MENQLNQKSIKGIISHAKYFNKVYKAIKIVHFLTSF